MDIGKEGTPFVIEPLVEPIPGREPAPAPSEPVAPVELPDRELVPA